MKIIEIKLILNKKNENHRNPYEKYENHENLENHYENNENHENLKKTIRTKI